MFVCFLDLISNTQKSVFYLYCRSCTQYKAHPESLQLDPQTVLLLHNIIKLRTNGKNTGGAFPSYFLVSRNFLSGRGILNAVHSSSEKIPQQKSSSPLVVNDKRLKGSCFEFLCIINF